MLADSSGKPDKQLHTIEQWMQELGPVPLQKAFVLRTVYDDVVKANDLIQVKNMLLDYIAYHHRYESITNDLLQKGNDWARK